MNQAIHDEVRAAPGHSSFPPRATRALLRGPSGSERRSWTADLVFRRVCMAAAFAILVLLGLIVLEMVSGARLSIMTSGPRFLVEQVWDPVAGRFGAAAFAYGTVVSSLLALVLAVPFGIGIAVFLVEVAPSPVRSPIAFLVELLAAIPSIVYGLWGLLVLAPFVRTTIAPALQSVLGFLPIFAGTSHGVGMLTAGMILAIMILPFIAAIARDVLTSVPREQREASLALGATRWETIWHVVLPYGRSGIVGGVILALGRALGETMAVTMVIGNNPQIAASLFSPGYSMSAVIANEYAEASGPLYLSALMEIGLVLFVITFTVNALARGLILRMARSAGKEAS